jgi:hypothetical protein
MFGKLYFVPPDLPTTERIALLWMINQALFSTPELHVSDHEINLALVPEQVNWLLGEALIFEGEFKTMKSGRTNANLRIAADKITKILQSLAETKLNVPERIKSVPEVALCSWVECTLKVLGTTNYAYVGRKVE